MTKQFSDGEHVEVLHHKKNWVWGRVIQHYKDSGRYLVAVMGKATAFDAADIRKRKAVEFEQ